MRSSGPFALSLQPWSPGSVATVLNLALRAWWPHYHEAETAFNFTFAMKLVRLVLGAISSLGAGFVAAWIGKSPHESGQC